jgi:cytochrome c-type biogenesis protein CcmH
MLQLVLTGLAGIVLGIVAMRVWQSREVSSAREASPAEIAPSDDASDEAKPVPAKDADRTRKLLIGAGALASLALVVLVLRPDEDAASTSAATPAADMAAPGAKAIDPVETMIEKLAKRLENEPNDGEGHRMLGWSWQMTGHPDKAIAPYRRAVVLLPGQANVHAGLGEALTGVAGGTVTDEAKSAFDRAIKLDASEPRARYFQAQWLAQNDRPKEALEQWIALANAGPADAPWQADLHKAIGDTAAKLGVDVSSRLKFPAPSALPAAAQPPPLAPPVIQAAQSLPAPEQQKMIDGMVEGLAAKLVANPKNPNGWIQLLRSRMVLKDGEQAGKDLASARRALAGSADLARIEAAATEFGVPGHK